MKRFKKVLAAFLLAASSFSVFAAKAKESEAVSQKILVEKVDGLSDDFMRGVDVSMLYEIEKNGGKYYNARGEEADLFSILKESGVNWIRLRVWNKPVQGGGSNSVDVDIPLAKRAKDAGFKLLVDFHYSDWWADPAKQTMPKDWENLSFSQLCDAVEKFTRESIDAFTKAGAEPDAIQIGNELNSGFMWPLGQLWSNDPNVKIGGMKNFTTLLTRASKGVRTAQNGGKMKIIIHLANGGDQNLYKWIFDEVKKAKVDYDIIGLSFYTYWHGSIDDLKANLEFISKRYGKEMAVVETAYGFTEEDGDDQGNVFLVYSDKEHGYVPSVQGQATAVRDVIEAVSSVKGGVGVFYWEPAWIPVKGAGLSNKEGDTWENQSMFDFKGRVLPSLNVFGLAAGLNPVENVWGGSAKNGSGFIPYAMADKLEVTAKPGSIPVLPSKIKIALTNDSEQIYDVDWENINWKNQKEGKVVVHGTIKNVNFQPEITVILSKRENLIDDPSFEKGAQIKDGKLGSWTLNGSSSACYMENNKSNAHSGNWTYKYWLGSAFKSILSQEISIQNGTYELSVWAMGGGGENNIRLFAANFDGTKRQITSKITNEGWQVWKQYKIKVPVTNGKITVGIYLDSNPDCWGNFDDVELVKVE